MHAGGVSGVAFAPDGRQFALCSADGTVTIRDTTSLAAIFTNRSSQMGGGVAFSADGRFFAHAVGDTVVLRDRPGYRELARWPAALGGFATLAFSPDSRLLAATSRTASSGARVTKPGIWRP